MLQVNSSVKLQHDHSGQIKDYKIILIMPNSRFLLHCEFPFAIVVGEPIDSNKWKLTPVLQGFDSIIAEKL